LGDFITTTLERGVTYDKIKFENPFCMQELKEIRMYKIVFLKVITLFLHENVQTEAVSIHFGHIAANRGHFYSDFGP
jgi:hypothetical protein